MSKRDNLHFRWNKAMSHQKTWNFAIGERESGKSVDSLFLLWNAYTYENRPSLLLRRRIADITSTYIDDIASVLNKFLEEPIQLLYLKGDVNSGIADIHIAPAGENYSYAAIKKLPVFFRVIGLSCPMNRIKSLMLKDVKYIFYDEFIANLRGGERYLTTSEYFLIQEIYTTYNREASTPIRILAAGNPYSVYNPLFNGLEVDTSKLVPGAFIVGDNYVISCFKTPPELKKLILANNPMYQFDDAYKRYAFSGESINDANIRLHKTEPRGFKLKWVFKVGSDFISIHMGSGTQDGEEYKYWVCKHNSDWLTKIGKRRTIRCFNFGDLMANSALIDGEDRLNLFNFREAIGKRKVTYNCIDASYLIEELYSFI